MNQNTMIGVGIVGGVLVFVVLLVILVRRSAKRKSAEWVQGASALGLMPSGRLPLLEFTVALDGIAVVLRQVQIKRRSGGRHKHPCTSTWCMTYASIPGGVGDLEVAGEGVFSAPGKLVGGTDHKSGDDAFDKRFLAQGSVENVPRLAPSALLRALAATANAFR